MNKINNNDNDDDDDDDDNNNNNNNNNNNKEKFQYEDGVTRGFSLWHLTFLVGTADAVAIFVVS